MDDGTKKAAGAVGAAVLALGAFAARFADDAARVGAASARVADDVVVAAHYGDDLAAAGGDLSHAGRGAGAFDDTALLARGRTGASIGGAHFDDGLAHVDDPWAVADEVVLEASDDADALDVALDVGDVALDGVGVAVDLAETDAPPPRRVHATVVVLDPFADEVRGGAAVASLAALDRALASTPQGPLLVVATESDAGVMGAPSEAPIAPAALLTRVRRPAALVLCPAPRTTACLQDAVAITTAARSGDPRGIPERLAIYRDISPSRGAITLRMLRRTADGTRLVTSAPR